MIENKSILGCKYYVHQGDNPVTFRVIGFQSSDTVIIRNENTGEKFKVLYNDLVKDFTKIIPDGILVIMTVGISDETQLQDIIVAYSTMNHISDGNNIPDIVCRQNINDIFNFVQNKNMTIVGCCATPTSMPEGVPYECMMACNSINSQIFMSTYIDDELDDILSCVKTKKIDNVLNELFESAISKLDKERKEKARQYKIYCGYVTTLKDLLEINTFMEEFYLANGILKLRFELCVGDTDISYNYKLNYESLQKLQEICGMIFNTHTIVEYKKDINVNMFGDNHYLLLKDSTNKLYVFGYTSDSVFDYEKVNYLKLYGSKELNSSLKNKVINY